MDVKLLVFLTGLSILAFLSTRYKDSFTEPYTFSKFMSHNHGVDGNTNGKEIVDFDKKGDKIDNHSESGDPFIGGGGE